MWSHGCAHTRCWQFIINGRYTHTHTRTIVLYAHAGRRAKWILFSVHHHSCHTHTHTYTKYGMLGQLREAHRSSSVCGCDTVKFKSAIRVQESQCNITHTHPHPHAPTHSINDERTTDRQLDKWSAAASAHRCETVRNGPFENHTPTTERLCDTEIAPPTEQRLRHRAHVQSSA